MFFTNPFKSRLPAPEEALAGRSKPIAVLHPHAVSGQPLLPPFPKGYKQIYLGLGCFWGAERLFWQMDGVWTTAVGYMGGLTKNPTYEEVCSGQTGHTEAVLVVYDPAVVSLSQILTVFWQSHDPTQGNRQGNDIGTQYRSAIYTADDTSLAAARESCKRYGLALNRSGFGPITTEIGQAGDFFYAEDYHQQYLHKVPNGYCGLAGCNVRYPDVADLT